MRGFRMGGVLAGALAAVSLAMMRSLDFRAKPAVDRAKKDKPPPQGSSNRSGKYKYSDRGESGQDPHRGTRLPLDRSSNVRKLQRWARAGTITLPNGSEKAVNRHKVRRIEIQRAKNLAELMASNA